MENKKYNIINANDNLSLFDKLKSAFRIASIPTIIASLCCLSPLILVMAGLATTSFAASLSDTLYGQYKWVFRSLGLIALLIAFYYHITRSIGICTLDDAKKRRNEIINKLAITVIIAVLSYIFFLYVVVEYIGKWYGVWR